MLRATPSSRQELLLKSGAFASFCTLTPSFPVDAGGRVTKELGSDNISDLSHDPQTGDLFLRFSGDRYLQFLQLSCGYEAWRLYMGDLEYICMGGGEYASFERTHFTANKTANKTLHPTADNAPV